NETPIESNQATTVVAGDLPPWEIDELPVPPQFTWRNILTTIGPGAILLGTSIGSSEWILGPAVTARYGGFLLWLIFVSIVLQAIINTESIRYTMYTGEPIYTGFMRTAPGSQFWALFYITLSFLQLIWPGWVSAAATALTALYLGTVPGPEHSYLIKIFGLLWLSATALVVIFGDKIERTLEKIQGFLVVAILLFLVLIVSFYTDSETYQTAVVGLTNFGAISPDLDWLLICAFVSDAGAGGVINGVISNWYRDKGIGMGSLVGYIPALVGGRKLSLMKTGRVFRPTPENKQRWRNWWKFVDVDQYFVWGVGCFLGMILPALITLQFIPPGTEFVNQFGIAVYQAQYIVWATGNQLLWNITLLVSFWILFSTQLGVTDAFVRIVTDLVWAGGYSENQQESDVRFVYYSVFCLFFLTGSLILFLDVQPLFLILIGASMSGLNMTIISLHTLCVNRKFLPPELKPPLWREIVVVLGAIFYGFLFCKAAPELFKQLFSF
ncbi:MAG: Nramp family divalent metal transporter, partial [Waterburya sp.]